ncbi:MAG: hypothetical protein A2583_04430 [Bdellovibrionales bacterium RIFOXYD1_FULL_53_11]|nr:MAG: hypothetical protein A2583_04430 [Bdellovibrionales bacterium RIFOXYD1_FULL_53_11]
MLGFLNKRWAFIAGLAAVLFYWYMVHPPGFSRIGYSEDFCPDHVRQVMAENLIKHGKPVFRTDSFFAPAGAAIPFISWSIERDWLGAYAWMISRDFPFLWIYFGLSLLLAFLGVGFILRRMGLGARSAWLLAAIAVTFNIPRHFKIYHHFEHLPEHWIYLAVFMDAWIWQRLWRENKWSWTLELWRSAVGLGMFCAAGYFWGPLVMEWMISHGAMLLLAGVRFRRGRRIAVEGSAKGAVWPLLACAALVVIEFRWYLPLVREALTAGKVYQPIGWFAEPGRLVEPLWLRPLLKPVEWIFGWHPDLPKIDISETVITVGWIYWLPALLAMLLAVRRLGGTGLGAVAPLALFLAVIVRYMVSGKPYWFRDLIQSAVPFMDFFRVASRMGLFLPATLAGIIALSWPEIKCAYLRARAAWPRTTRWTVYACVFLGTLEAGWLSYPVSYMPPVEKQFEKLLEGVRDAPGRIVLDLPFCVAGGNGVCTNEQCPNYPHSAVGQCLRGWHDKAIHGLYQARTVEAHCRIYNKEPYTSWFDAWRMQRCFEDREWDNLCRYLESVPGIAAVLVYPDVWTGAGAPDCQAKFREYLGMPLGDAGYFQWAERGGIGKDRSKVVWYAPKCLKRFSSVR